MTAVRLEATDLRLVRGGRVAVDVTSLELHHGEVLALLGPNGAGKSTLVQLMALLVKPTAGEILYNGARVRNMLACRRRMAVVLQEPLLLDTTVESNVASGLALRGVSREERKRRSGVWLERFGIGHLARRSSRTLSGGEAQRVSLARAFVVEPEILFLDEPFSSLDAPTRQALTGDLHSLLGNSNMATVFVTHDRAEALRLGDRIAVMMDGRIRQIGTPEEIFGMPADEDVAQFVGVETITYGRVQSVDDGVALVEVGGHTIEGGSGVDAGDDVLVCLRPEDVSISPAREGGHRTSVRNHLPARVTSIMPWGAFQRLELDAGFPLVALITRHAVEDLELVQGSDVTAGFKATAVHLIKRRSA